MAKDDLHNIEDLNRRLYRRRHSPDEHQRLDQLHSVPTNAPTEWKPTEEKKNLFVTVAKHPSLFKKFFYFSIGFAFLAVVAALVIFFTNSNTVSNTNIDIQVLGNSFTPGGEELPLQVEIINKNATQLELADLFIEYDKGGDASSGAGRVRETQSLGIIPPGKTVAENVAVTLFGEEGSVKNIDLRLQYRIRGSNAVFVKTSSFPVTISSAPISLSVDAPDNVTPNQDLTFTVKIKSNSKSVLSGLLARVEYPTGFQFTSASPDASAFNNVWNIGDLPPGAEKEISITGTIYGQDGEDRAFHVYTGAASAKDNTSIGLTYNSLLHVVTLVKPFIGAQLAINGSSAPVVPVSSGSTAQVLVSWENNLPTRITDAEIRVQLSGNALNASSISPRDGFYDSATNTIVWDKTTSSQLAAIEPGATGSLDFSFAVAPLYTSQTALSRPSVKLSVSIKGKEADAGGLVSEITNFEEKMVSVSSDLGFSTTAYHSSGPFSNTGPIPPQANQPTTYTITWAVTNSANTLSDALATTTLPSYVEWVGTTLPKSESIEYDSTTRTVRWRIGQVASGTGLSAGTPRTVSFQVRLTPSTTQHGTAPKITLDTNVSAKDTFTGQTLTTSRLGLTTRLDNEPGFPPGGDVVQ